MERGDLWDRWRPDRYELFAHSALDVLDDLLPRVAREMTATEEERLRESVSRTIARWETRALDGFFVGCNLRRDRVEAYIGTTLARRSKGIFSARGSERCATSDNGVARELPTDDRKLDFARVCFGGGELSLDAPMGHVDDRRLLDTLADPRWGSAGPGEAHHGGVEYHLEAMKARLELDNERDRMVIAARALARRGARASFRLTRPERRAPARLRRRARRRAARRVVRLARLASTQPQALEARDVAALAGRLRDIEVDFAEIGSIVARRYGVSLKRNSTIQRHGRKVEALRGLLGDNDPLVAQQLRDKHVGRGATANLEALLEDAER